MRRVNSRRRQRGWWNFILPIAGSLLGASMTNKSRENVANDTSEFNSAEAALQRQWASTEAETAREFNSAQASRQMDFQKEMSNTQWQRGVKDMQAAGLNPMLAFSQGPASAPSGASASASAPGGATASGVTPEVSDVLGGAVATAQQARRVDQELANMRAQEDLTKAQRDNVAQQTINLGTESDRIVADTERIKAATKLAGVQYDVNVESVQKIIQEIKESKSREDNNKVENILKNASVAEAKAVEQFFKSALGESNPFVKMIIGIISAMKR